MTFSSVSDPRQVARINDIIDRLQTNIDRKMKIRQATQERLDRARAEAAIADREAKTALQAKADDSYSLWGEAPPKPLSDEGVGHYRRRLVADMQRHLPAGDKMSRTRFPGLRKEATAVLDRLEPDLVEAFKAARFDPATAPLTGERAIEQVDPHTGARTTLFNRRTSFIADMGLPCRKVHRLMGSEGGVGPIKVLLGPPYPTAPDR
jgi:hypothetical protein